MLKMILLWVAVCVCGQLSAQDVAALECRVDGGLRMNVENRVHLYEVVKGALVERASGGYGKEGYVGFRFIPAYEGFYMVGDEKNYCYPVWVKGGDCVSVALDRDGARLYGKKNSRENEVLYKWVKVSGTVGDMSGRGFKFPGLTAADFFREVERLDSLSVGYKQEVRTKNGYFNGMMLRYVDFSKDYYALNYLSTPKPVGFKWPVKEDYSPYYAGIVSKEKFRDEEVLKVPNGFCLLGMYTDFALRMSGGDRSGDGFEAVPSVVLRGELALKRLGWQRSRHEFRKLLKVYEPLFSGEQRQEAGKMLKELEDKNARQQTVDFTFPDVSGKPVSLSDFKGKVVLLDIWATWCGPCRQELPHLRKLEEEMKGEDLVVIGVSTDVKKDYVKWKKMVDEGTVTGVQLFADGGKALRADYGVTGIPRFIVFDRAGKVYESVAPRPSNSELKELLKELLKK